MFVNFFVLLFTSGLRSGLEDLPHLARFRIVAENCVTDWPRATHEFLAVFRREVMDGSTFLGPFFLPKAIDALRYSQAFIGGFRPKIK